MKLGKLNELLDNIGLNIAYADSTLVPAIEENGNPLKGEHFLIKWQSIYDKAVALHITLPQVCFVDRVCLQLGEKVALQAASLLRGCTATAPRPARLSPRRNSNWRQVSCWTALPWCWNPTLPTST